MFKLVIQDDEGKTTVVPLARDEITIGRKEGNTIRLTERNVSRRHARILRANGEVTIEDLGSYNGIRVNNARIAERVQLRVSDQVQIGDYKLFLKAEGLEHVDDAKTVPIERVETATSIDAVPAVESSAPPMPPTAAGSMPPGRLVGNPNQTLVALGDTDPAGRPIASAAVHGNLNQAAVGYGRLVVLSSNFAGSEFELSRLQMIIGRTDENDIVINHRSISRNHAKIVREPDTGRYTISDLQSSNGVRVNGQDYGKVELRRGDVIDLGHVRMRFVDAGEEYVFTRDAIEDVPEEGRSRGLWIMVALAALALGLGSYFAFVRGRGESKPDGGGSGGSGSAIIATTADAATSVEPDAATPIPTTPDAATPIPATPDAAPASPPDAGPAQVTDDPVARKKADCMRLAADESWAELDRCAAQLRTLANPAPAEAEQLARQAAMERKAKAQYDIFQAADRREDLARMAGQVRTIPDESMYAERMKTRWNTVKDKFLRQKRQAAEAAASAGRCGDVRTLARQVESIDKNTQEWILARECVDPAKRPCTDADAKAIDDQLSNAHSSYEGNPNDAIATIEQIISRRNNPCVQARGTDAAQNRYDKAWLIGMLAACKANNRDKAEAFLRYRARASVPEGCRKLFGE